jgi:hypothetical protein
MSLHSLSGQRLRASVHSPTPDSIVINPVTWLEGAPAYFFESVPRIKAFRAFITFRSTSGIAPSFTFARSRLSRA